MARTLEDVLQMKMSRCLLEDKDERVSGYGPIDYEDLRLLLRTAKYVEGLRESIQEKDKEIERLRDGLSTIQEKAKIARERYGEDTLFWERMARAVLDGPPQEGRDFSTETLRDCNPRGALGEVGLPMEEVRRLNAEVSRLQLDNERLHTALNTLAADIKEIGKDTEEGIEKPDRIVRQLDVIVRRIRNVVKVDRT